MALSLSAAESCKYLSAIINYPVTAPLSVQLQITNSANTNIAGEIDPLFNLTSGSGAISYPIPVVNLSVNYGVVIVTAVTSTGVVLGEPQAVLLHCDIDCCLTKLTNELIDCGCECSKCASSLAKAQKIFLLIKSSEYALIQADNAELGNQEGYIKDADNKYKKAFELCDNSCGCDC